MSGIEMARTKSRALALLLAVSASASCASGKGLSPADFAVQVKGSGPVRITGWARLRGEIMVFPSRQAMQQKSRYPACVSGVFQDQASRELAQYDGKKVIITGDLVRFDTLTDEDAPLLRRKVLAGSVIPNFCFGENVLLIRSIEKAP